MDLQKELLEYVFLNGIQGETVMDYDAYIKQSVRDYPAHTGEARNMDDLVSVLGWDTTEMGLKCFAYCTLLGGLSNTVKLKYKSGTQTMQHKHNFVELTYVAKGRLIQNIAGKNIVFSEGEICLVDRETIHWEVLLHEVSTVICLGIDNSFFEQFMQTDRAVSENVRNLKHLITRKKTEYDYLRFVPKYDGMLAQQTFEVIVSEMFHQKPCRTRIVEGYVERLFHLLPLEYRIVLIKKERKELGKALFHDIEEYVENNYQTATVQKLAAIYNYNADYISRLCSSKTGMSMSQYIQKVRIKKSLSLLESTDLSVEQVAMRVGYNNIGFFYKKFREYYHTTPNKIRSV